MTYPIQKLALPPDETGYTITEYSDSLVVGETLGGMPRSRLDQVGGRRMVTVQWSGTPARWQTVRNFFKQNIALNCPQFKLDLIVGNAAYAEYLCQCVPNTIRTATPKGKYWTFQCRLEVAPRSDESRYAYLFASHFDGDLYDETGNFTFTTVGTAPGFNSSTQRFGSGDLDLSGSTALVSNNYGVLNLGDSNFEISGWVKLDNLGSYHMLLAIHAQVSNGDRADLVSGDCMQLRMHVDVGTTPPQLFVVYCAHGSGNSADPPQNAANDFRLKQTRTDVGFVANVWTHVYLVQDNISIRAYLNGIKVAEDFTHRMNFGSDFTNQGLTLGGTYAGGGWPGVYAAYLSGELDDWYILRGIDEATFKGDSFTPPKKPFGNGIPKLLAPDQASYAITDPQNRLNDDIGALAGNYRRNLINSNYIVDVGWQCSFDEYAKLAKIYRSAISYGGVSFPADLFIDGTEELLTYEASFVKGSFKLDNVSGETFSVSASLSVVPVPYDVDTQPFVSSDGLSRIIFNPLTGAYVLTGKAVNLRPSKTKMAAATGIYLLGGQAVILAKRIQSQSLTTGSYVVTGYDATLTKLGALLLREDGSYYGREDGSQMQRG